ncbi:uncharacterized protein PV09_01746 [Verruconis gallopava]|uniref:Uncharacterized protein n=1 Tax=Verruconis gallopava TaxID=253628 RepID=A0A0D2AM29_9PEZI|nr:uncharacterized protein PV09_01746 [Verruconis gallopava]KIW07828.1 hypothetical protein PV09_01746 [Verruconis gallopava]
MFDFVGSNRNMSKRDIFNDDEVRQLVLDLPPQHEGSTDNTLIPLSSGTGFTTRDALARAFSRLIQGKYGKIPIAAIGNHLEVRQDALLETLRGRKDFMLSKSKEDIITRCDQERILEDLYAKAQLKFVLAKEFADQNDLDVQSVEKLVILSEDIHNESPLQLLDAPNQSRARSLEGGQSYIHALSTLLELRRSVIEKAMNSNTAARIAVWNTNDMYGLDTATFGRLAQKLAQEFNGSEPLYGTFEIGKDEVRYITKSYLLRKAKRSLKEVAIGDEAFCDLEQLVKKYPTLLPDIEAARQLAERECLHKDGSRYKWHFISHYVIGDVGLNNTAKRCLETLGPQRYLNTQPFVQSFPADIRKDVLNLLQNRTVELWRYCGGVAPLVLGMDEWLVLKSIIGDVEIASKRLGRECADESWKKEAVKPCLTQEPVLASFLKKLVEESDLPIDLLSRLWDDERVKIKPIATKSFDERITELIAEERSQLESLWMLRAYLPAKQYENALKDLEPGSLRDQLQDLLAIHLTQDLVPATVTKIRTKSLLHDHTIQKNVSKLESVLSAEKRDTPIMKSLDKFHEKMGFAAVKSEDLVQTRQRQLEDMVRGMKGDDDAPRLFLTMIIVMLATRKGKGIVYATGKFAPRLLKLLKSDLSDEQYSHLEKLKHLIKSGNVNDDDRAEIRKLTIEAFESISHF